MPTAQVDNAGTQLYYTDSGPVAGSNDYTTLVIYHGSAFTGTTFHKLLNFGAADNIRVVVLNRRHYAGSTKYTEAELRDLREGKDEFMSRRGREVAHFLLWFAETYQIPKIIADRKSGGIAVMGWSMGSTTTLSLLGYPDIIGSASYQRLEVYFRRLILYDPPLLAFGYDQPPEGYDPFQDPEFKTPQAAFENFGRWVSAYYDHPNLASCSITGLSFAKCGARPSVENMTPEEMAVNFDGEAAAATEYPTFIHPMQPTIKRMAQTCLFDEKRAAEVLPHLEIIHLACTKTNWYCSWGAIETERQYSDHRAHGRKVRPIRFAEIEGVNHFVHWDDPKLFWGCVVDAVKV